MQLFDLTAERKRLALAPDCASCFGLCCVAHGFKASTSFAYNKLPGTPCRNLLPDFGCGIHGTLRDQGFRGCTAYTCFGAGQKVAQAMFGGTDWQDAPETAGLMFQTLPIVRQLHEHLWYVTEALDRCPPGAVHNELLVLLAETERLTATRADELSWGNIDAHCRAGENLLSQVSEFLRRGALFVDHEGPDLPSEQVPEVVRAAKEHHHQAKGTDRQTTARRSTDRQGADPDSGDLRGADLRGAVFRDADLRGADLRGADLRGADLRGADLRGANLRLTALPTADLSDADLRWTDLMGADLDRANLPGADLSAALFLTQGQLELADGNTRTILSDPLRAPAHWSGGEQGVPDDATQRLGSGGAARC